MRSRPNGLLILLAVAATLVGGCGGDDSPETVTVDMPTTPMSTADAEAVDRAVAEVWTGENKTNVPALYVGVWDPQKGVFTKAYGDAATGVPATTADSLRIGSISKSFTANVILQLAADGELSLDDTIADVAPEVASRFPSVADRTIQQLLGMHSGISDYLNTKDGVARDVVARPDRVWTPDELIAVGVGVGVEPAGKPGGYSTTNYILLQEIAVEVTGSSLADLIRTDVTVPLGLDHTFLPPNDDSALPEPAGHSRVTPTCRDEFVNAGADVALGTDLTMWSVSYGQGGGGMTSTLGDLGRWAASGTGDALLPADLMAQRNTIVTLGDGLPYGLGVVKLGDWYGHAGENLGWETLALTNPKTGVSVAFMGTSCGISGVFGSILDKLYKV